MKGLLSKSSDPNANVGTNEVHQAKTSYELKLGNHKARIGEDEIHLCKCKRRLENGIHTY